MIDVWLEKHGEDTGGQIQPSPVAKLSAYQLQQSVSRLHTAHRAGQTSQLFAEGLSEEIQSSTFRPTLNKHSMDLVARNNDMGLIERGERQIRERNNKIVRMEMERNDAEVAEWLSLWKLVSFFANSFYGERR